MSMSPTESRLEQTISSYALNAAEYARTTPVLASGGLKAWLDACVSSLPKTARILELGSGTGRDALYLESLGYEVVCSDITPYFIQILKIQNHKHVLALDALKDNYPPAQDLIFADAVAVHFEEEQMQILLNKAHNILNNKGLLALTLKTSNEYKVERQDRLGNPRWFTMWPEERILHLAEKNNFKIIYNEKSYAGQTKSKWLNLIMEKIS